MSRFTDGYVFGEEPRTAPPATLNILLNELGVDFAPPSEQRSAVAKWLESHQPGERLVDELRQRLLAE